MQAEWKRLQAEVADLRQANKRLQSALQDLSSRQVMLSDNTTSPTLPLAVPHLPWKVRQLPVLFQFCFHYPQNRLRNKILSALCSARHALSISDWATSACQAPEVLDRHILKRLMPVWHSGAIGSCTVTAEQAADMHQVASLSSQQMIILWQVTCNPL